MLYAIAKMQNNYDWGPIFALCYQTVVCPICPVCNVGVLWPNGWTDQDKLGMRVGLGTGHILLDGDPAPLSQKGGRAPSPI